MRIAGIARARNGTSSFYLGPGRLLSLGTLSLTARCIHVPWLTGGSVDLIARLDQELKKRFEHSREIGVDLAFIVRRNALSPLGCGN